MKAYMNWSGGKDSALAFYEAVNRNIEIGKLFTTVNAAHDRISMHGVRRTLLETQAAAIGLPLLTAELPEQPGMEEYEKEMSGKVAQLKNEGYTTSVFGDIFLEDLRRYREEQMQKMEMTACFPLWQKDTKELVRSFISLGFKAIVVCVNGSLLDPGFCGRLIDDSFLHDLPAGVDICGENGEYHSFVFDGPIFHQPVPFVKGERVRREYPTPQSADDCFTEPKPPTPFYFCDLLPQ